MADKSVELRWTGSGQRFEGGPPRGPQVVLDGDGATGPSPMDGLLLSVAGCMAIDVLMILEKGRVTVRDLSIHVEGDRQPEPPRYFNAVRMTYRIEGPTEDDRGKVDRAVELSRDRYCSVLHSLRPDLALEIQVELA